ncbi:MAG: pyridoxamine 5'-phosphate oxidase family protein [Solirubrobacteraceae bacterium]|nr:pyridoxamine 5'-phosphate oxidase family protein [Solirubrobacteraceae bacterium]
MSRRDLIVMTDDELAGFLDEVRVVTCASIGPEGRPHLMPLWFVRDGLDVLCWTFAKSQKAKNLERDPRATLSLELGDTYDQLRGAMFETDVELIHETPAVAEIGLAITSRYALGGAPIADAPPELRQMIEGQATKRVAMRFRATRTVTWDHRKLGGTY